MKAKIFLLTLLITVIGLNVTAQDKEGAARPTPRIRPDRIGPETTDKRPPIGAISSIRIITVTGGDDLRNDSRVSAFLILRDGRRIQSPPLNCLTTERNPSGDGWTASRCAKIPNETRRTFVWNFDNVEYARPADVHRFGLAFESGRSGPFDTGDNWNLDRLEVEYFVVPGSETKAEAARRGPTQVLRLGPPVHRFKTREEWESNPLRLGESGGVGIKSPTGSRP